MDKAPAAAAIDAPLPVCSTPPSAEHPATTAQALATAPTRIIPGNGKNQPRTTAPNISKAAGKRITQGPGARAFTTHAATPVIAPLAR